MEGHGPYLDRIIKIIKKRGPHHVIYIQEFADMSIKRLFGYLAKRYPQKVHEV